MKRTRRAKVEREGGVWDPIDCRIWVLTRQVRWAQRQRERDRRDRLAEELIEAWSRCRFHEYYRLAHMLAGHQVGPRSRSYNHLQPARPSREEWRSEFAKPGGEGGWELRRCSSRPRRR